MTTDIVAFIAGFSACCIFLYVVAFLSVLRQMRSEREQHSDRCEVARKLQDQIDFAHARIDRLDKFQSNQAVDIGTLAGRCDHIDERVESLEGGGA